MHADLCSLLRPPPTRAEQPHNLFSCVYSPKGIIPSIDEWTTLWAHVERSPNTERRFDALMYGAVGLRHWLGSCTLPRIIPTTRKAFEGSGLRLGRRLGGKLVVWRVTRSWDGG